MFEYGLCTENYNPELLFAFQGVVDGTKKNTILSIIVMIF